MLHEFITVNHDEIVARTRRRIAERATPCPTEIEFRHVPLFLDQLVARLSADTTDRAEAMSASASNHGADLLKLGHTVGQVVHDYGNACQSITKLAVERGALIPPEDYAKLNRVLDEVIADAVTEFGRQREQRITGQGVEKLGSLVHEMRNVLSTAILSFEVLSSGKMGVESRTGMMIGKSLQRMRDLIDRSMAEIRLEAGARGHDRVVVAELLEEIEVAASSECAARHIDLEVAPIALDLVVDGDHPIVTSIISNLVQNACKFTVPGGHVVVRTRGSANRVVIEVEDQCGGLPPGKAEELFQPFEQRGADRTGLGLGLAIAQRGVEAHHGAISVRNVPGHGCIFAVELPRRSSCSTVTP